MLWARAKDRMKFFGLFFSFLILFELPTLAAQISLKNLDALEDSAIFDRLDRLLVAQDKKWQFCKPAFQAPRNSWQALIKSHVPFSSLRSQEQKQNIVMLISALRATRQKTTDCIFLNTEITSLRKKIFVPPAFGSETIAYLKSLQPACYPVASKGTLSGKDKNACFAADDIIFSDLRRYGISFPSDSIKLANALFDKLLKSEINSSLDLFEVFLENFPDKDLKSFFPLLATISTSGNSGLTGWLQGIEDRLLVQDLNNLRLSPFEVYRRSKILQMGKINYQKFRDVSSKFNVKLTIFGNDISDWNRHNMMAAYLGCRDTNNLNTTIRRVSVVGRGYEAKDFVSHLIEGNSLKTSVNNYKRDTHRYLEGAKLGWQACH